MKCQENKQMIYAYLDGELSEQEERNLYSHMAVCDDCRLDMERAKSLQELLKKTMEHVEPPQDFAQKVMANLPSKIDANEQAQILAELDLFKEESATEEAAKKDIENVNEIQKAFRFNKRWIGIAAGLVFAFFALSGIYQVVEVARTDPPVPEHNDTAIEQCYEENQQRENNLEMEQDNRENQQRDNNIMVGYGNEGNQQREDSPAGTVEDSDLPDDVINQQQDNQIEMAQIPDDANINKNDVETVQGSDSNIESSENDGSEFANQEEAVPVRSSVAELEADPFVITEPTVGVGNNPTSTVTLTHLLEDVLGATWGSSDNSLLYLTQSNGSIRAFEIQVNGDNRRSIGTYSTVGIWSPNQNYMAFTQNVGGRSTIWIEGRDGRRNLTPEEAGEKSEGINWAYNPVWSSEYEIAFLTDRFGGTDIMVVDMAGNSRRVTFSGDNKENLVWSPDGNKIAYFRTWDSGGLRVGEIAIVCVNEETSKSVTPIVRTNNMVATWSPDSRLLAVNVTGAQQGIWVTSTDGGDWDRRLTTRGGGRIIEWSPDGQKVAFNDSQGVFHILIWRSAQVNVDIMQITGGQMANASIEWSRDSKEILLKQPIAGSDNKSVWVATLPRSVRAH